MIQSLLDQNIKRSDYKAIGDDHKFYEIGPWIEVGSQMHKNLYACMLYTARSFLHI